VGASPGNFTVLGFGSGSEIRELSGSNGVRTFKKKAGVVSRYLVSMRTRCSVTGAPYREVNSKVATAPKLKIEDKDRVNNSRRIKTVKLNIVKLKATLNKFSRGKVVHRSRMPNA